MKITLPWGCLVSDNEKYTVSRGRKILGARYRNGLAAATLHVKRQVRLRDMLCDPCAIVCTFHEPNRSRTRDVSNYSKLICDALKGRAIVDDGLIDDARYVRGHIDPAKPRVEITITEAA